MKQELSVLIPTYNCNCVDLVKSLHWQLKRQNISYEIIVVDDGSTDKEYVKENKAIEALDGVNYIVHEENMGRSAIRNFLADQSQHEWLLFIDGDTLIDRARFIEIYLEQEKGDVVVGGYNLRNDYKRWHNNLRFLVEMDYIRSRNNKKKKKKDRKYKEFHTANFMVTKEVMTKIPFHEDFKSYGYEDVMFGKELQENGIAIKHINNPVTLSEFEDNPTYVAKTEEAMRTLHEFRHELSGYSKILEYNWLKPLLCPCYYLFGKIIRRKLVSKKPTASLFNLYKLMYYSKL